jgi:hypothetical protein
MKNKGDKETPRDIGMYLCMCLCACVVNILIFPFIFIFIVTYEYEKIYMQLLTGIVSYINHEKTLINQVP